MRSVAVCVLLASIVARPGSLRAQEKDLLDKAIALQKVTQKVIAVTEPSIACILVSRSDEYRRLGYVYEPEESGRLGAFELKWPTGLDDKEKKKIRTRLDLSDPNHVPQAFGSGVVIDAKGLVLTNYHVVQGATKIYVRLPGPKGSYADIHAADPRSDLAVLRLRKPVSVLQAIPLGDADKLERGQFLLSLSNPFAAGFRDGQPSASWGILSNIRRRRPIEVKEEERVQPLHHYGILLQTDSRLHLGCSGGALLNLKGELVGLTTALAAIQGGETPGGFALPMDGGYRRIIEVLKRGEEVEYGFLGVGPADERQIGATHGVLIKSVTPGSPAALGAKLRDNYLDAILAVNGMPINDTDDLFLYLGTQLAGTKVQLDVRRQGSPETTKAEATLAKFYVPGKRIFSSLGKRPYFRGMRVDYTSLLYLQSQMLVQRVPSGVMISDVASNSPAATAQLKSGEVITHVNQVRVSNPAEFYQAVAGVNGAVELTIQPSANEPSSKVTLR
ncbi:MAG: trypsin-like peptidase domain-containing protein [Planctomycetes bacterium]|nr:trypsin-like peptidase domain-containing protein [Planctomycetota bacterium]